MDDLLFAYGTLLDSDVQQYVFQRTLEGVPDLLPRFVISPKKMYGRYLVLQPTGNEEDEVTGKAYRLHRSELLMVDIYEGPAYKRVIVSLKSGQRAWVYIEKQTDENRL